MADKIVVLQGGRVEQIGSPLELYLRPANLFVAKFIGSPKMNVLKVRVDGLENGCARLGLPGGASLKVPASGVAMGRGEVMLGIRPEHILLDGTQAVIPGRVRLTEHLGSETIIHADIPDGGVVVARADGLHPARIGDSLSLGFSPSACHLFHPDGAALVNGAPAH